jgi:putative spermidine/putrescine transport system permease protein
MNAIAITSAVPQESSVAADALRLQRRLRMLLLLPAAATLTLFFAFPLMQNVARSLGVAELQGSPTLGFYRRLFTDSYYVGVVLNTLKVSAITTALCLLLGYPIAYFMVRRARRFAVPLLLVLVTPLLTSIIMRTFGWRVLLARRGLLNDLLMWLDVIQKPLNLLGTEAIVYLGMVHVMVPFMVLSIVPVLRSVDTRLEESARILGAGAIRTFLLVTLPLSIEGVITGCALVFMVANGSFITMLLLGDGSVVTLPLLVFQQFSQAQDLSFASAMGTVLLVIVVGCLYLQAHLVRSKEAR